MKTLLLFYWTVPIWGDFNFKLAATIVVATAIVVTIVVVAITIVSATT